VNIKWYLKREGLLDTSESVRLDYYLVLAGPRSAAASSRGSTRRGASRRCFSLTRASSGQSRPSGA
jgi:hypothetical protein